ncbi:MAG: NAD(P)H-hydrate dehydratase [Thermotogae bacterium]|nr:NAD(P)H-hydrate dehydratase [Thermotogota bacterium]
MRNVFSFSHSKRLDSWAESIGITGETLMEIAAAGIFAHLIEEVGSLKGRKVVVVAGKGNNGGDGVACGRRCALSGAEVKIYLPEGELSPLLRKQLEMFDRFSLGEIKGYDDPSFALDLATADVVVDAIFGVGFNGEVTDPYSHVIELINTYSDFVLSVDVPSGVDENGKVGGPAVKANLTVCLGAIKTSVLLFPGRRFAGEVKVVDFGIPLGGDFGAYRLYEDEDIRSMLPERLGNENKGSFGRVAIFAGSYQYPGTVYLTAVGALRSGVGLVYSVVPKSLKHVVNSPPPLPDVIMVDVPDRRGHFIRENVEYVERAKMKFDAYVVGPGITRFPAVLEFVSTLLKTFPHLPGVIDADALFTFKNKPLPDNSKLVLTPHPGELGSITGKSPRTIDEERITIARRISTTFPGVLVLKGAPTVIAYRGQVVINPTGNTTLARGGSGDLLSGLIGGLLAQGMDPFEAAIAGAYIHGKAAELMPSERPYRVIEVGSALAAALTLIEKGEVPFIDVASR